MPGGRAWISYWLNPANRLTAILKVDYFAGGGKVHPGLFLGRHALPPLAAAACGSCACRKMCQLTENHSMAPTSKQRKPRQSGSRRPMTRDMLLPLPATIWRRRSLEHHLAPAALRSGNCNVKLIGRLFRTVYLPYFVHATSNGRRSLWPFRISEAALHDIAVRIKAGSDWSNGHTAYG